MVSQNLLDDIKNSLEQGKSKEGVYRELLDRGWKIEVIQENFNSLSTEEEKVDTQKKTIRIIVTIAAVLVGAGIFSFIAANWRIMTRPIKIFVIVIAMLVSYTTGWYFKEKLNLLKTGGALIFLGTIIYGAGIFLVAQIFNIRANWPDGFILWMFGVLAVAFAMESFSLFYVAIVLGLIALFGHPWTLITTFSGHNPFLLTSSFLLLTATVVTFISGLVMRKRMPPELKEFY